MDNLRFNISIPSDEDGCVLFQCPNCGELFKVAVDEYESDSVLDIHCPLCGLISDSFFTPDVIALALSKTANVVVPELEDLIKEELGGKGNGLVSFSVKSYNEKEPEIPIRQAIEAFRR